MAVVVIGRIAAVLFEGPIAVSPPDRDLPEGIRICTGEGDVGRAVVVEVSGRKVAARQSVAPQDGLQRAVAVAQLHRKRVALTVASGNVQVSVRVEIGEDDILRPAGHPVGRVQREPAANARAQEHRNRFVAGVADHEVFDAVAVQVASRHGFGQRVGADGDRKRIGQRSVSKAVPDVEMAGRSPACRVQGNQVGPAVPIEVGHGESVVAGHLVLDRVVARGLEGAVALPEEEIHAAVVPNRDGIELPIAVEVPGAHHINVDARRFDRRGERPISIVEEERQLGTSRDRDAGQEIELAVAVEVPADDVVRSLPGRVVRRRLEKGAALIRDGRLSNARGEDLVDAVAGVGPVHAHTVAHHLNPVSCSSAAQSWVGELVGDGNLPRESLSAVRRLRVVEPISRAVGGVAPVVPRNPHDAGRLVNGDGRFPGVPVVLGVDLPGRRPAEPVIQRAAEEDVQLAASGLGGHPDDVKRAVVHAAATVDVQRWCWPDDWRGAAATALRGSAVAAGIRADPDGRGCDLHGRL